jgi:hypothetical protein
VLFAKALDIKVWKKNENWGLKDCVRGDGGIASENALLRGYG